MIEPDPPSVGAEPRASRAPVLAALVVGVLAEVLTFVAGIPVLAGFVFAAGLAVGAWALARRRARRGDASPDTPAS